jgi:protein-disulfide isomerase
MKAALNFGALALAFTVAACGESGNSLSEAANSNAPLPQIAAPNNGDWTQMVTQTEGGYLMGNPDAPVKLVEYASLACPHCAAFSEQGAGPLRDTYVRSGQVSWEYRHFLLNAPDVAFTLLARCQPPAAFFGTAEAMFRQQSEFFSALDEAESRRISALPPEQQIEPLARAMDLDTFFARRGMPGSRFSECLNDRQSVQQITDMTNRASSEQQVRGTPTFLINGEKQDETVGTWATLEPRLRAALGR